MNNYAVIMAGGVGTRFWPKGTAKFPKQFLSITDSPDSLIQLTFKRLLNIFSPEKIFVVTNIEYKIEVKKQLPDIPDNNILCEPCGRNTAACIGLATLFIKQYNDNANILVVASDHLIKDEDEFQKAIKSGLKFVNDNGGIVTLGIKPTHPETGYGYIQFEKEQSIELEFFDSKDTKIRESIFKVKNFTEKPNFEAAKKFLRRGDYVWNSGMFIFNIGTMLDEIRKSLPKLNTCLLTLREQINSDKFDECLRGEYEKLDDISIDYGIMEKSENVYTIISNFRWNDVGSWDEIYNISEKDKNNNVKRGKVTTLDTKNCLIINDQKRVIALSGVKDLLVIDTENGLLICKKDESQKVKELVKHLKNK